MTSPRERLKAWQEQRGALARQAWRATDALRRGLVLGVAMVIGGALLHRLAPVLLGAPLLVGSVLALLTPVGGQPRIRVRPLPRTVESGQRARPDCHHDLRERGRRCARLQRSAGGDARG